MFCEKCGQELPEGTKFCTSCGEKVISPDMTVPLQKVEAETDLPEEAFEPQPPDPQKSAEAPLHESEAAEKHRSTMPIIIGIVCAAIVIGAVALFLLFSAGASESKVESSEGESMVAESVLEGSASEISTANREPQQSEAVEGSEAGTGEGRVFSGFNMTPSPQSATEAAKSVEDAFGDSEVSSMTYMLNDGGIVMIITNSDSFEWVKVDIDE